MQQLGHVGSVDSPAGYDQRVVEPFGSHLALGGCIGDDLSEGLFDNVPRHLYWCIELTGSHRSPEWSGEGLNELSGGWQHMRFVRVVDEVGSGS